MIHVFVCFLNVYAVDNWGKLKLRNFFKGIRNQIEKVEHCNLKLRTPFSLTRRSDPKLLHVDPPTYVFTDEKVFYEGQSDENGSGVEPYNKTFITSK